MQRPNRMLLDVQISPRMEALAALARSERACRACPLWKDATQTVPGEGKADARLVLVGEQPGDAEDRAGRPFVGPAGRLLDRALAEAGIDRDVVFITNVVKHFKWEPRGKRRLHSKPNTSEVRACMPWLEGEIAALAPDVPVACLGATAAQAILGPQFRVTQQRGQWFASKITGPRPRVLATIHPSAILRERDDGKRDELLRGFVADLTVVATAMGRGQTGRGQTGSGGAKDGEPPSSQRAR